MAGIRIKRLEKLIQQVAAQTVLYELNDPRLDNLLVTITRVELAGDLSQAIVGVSVLGNEVQKRLVLRALADARGVVQGAVASRMHTRITPRLVFKLDQAAEKALELEKLIEKARQSDPDGGQPGEEAAPDDESTEPAEDAAQEKS